VTDQPLTPARLAAMQACFEEALELDLAAREVMLARVAVGDADLAAKVRALLQAHQQTGDALQRPLKSDALDAITALPDRWIGTRVGVHDVVALIGAGGMGTVYEGIRADDQYQRRVAIKVLRQRAAGEVALQRFRDERQILANLDHPNIAALLDGGVTADGEPYFVMEYLEGEPITRWCDARTLTVSERLALFLQVCAAVHYAHQRLVVHRDLKPANILVTEQGIVKLLDFGIAKLLPRAGEGDGHASVTQAHLRAYTPDYASPEQLLGKLVATPSDVYALGVVLHELLTGTRPFDFSGRSAGEVERLVSETVPARPSGTITEARAGALGERSGARARGRIAGDLDAIILKALRKEPERRYGSVEELAADVKRHLDGHPVQARPDGFGYQVAKLVRRRRTETTLVVVAVVLLVGGVVATSVKANEAVRERERVTEVKSFLTTMLGAASPEAFGKDVQVRTVLDSAALRADSLHDRPALEGEIRGIIGGTYVALGEFELAEAQYRKQLALAVAAAPGGSRETARAMMQVSAAFEYEGRYAAADSLLTIAGPMLARFSPNDAQARADFLDVRGRVLLRLGRAPAADTALAEVLAIELSQTPVNDSAIGSAYANLGVVRSELGHNESAESLLVQAVAASRRAFGPVHPLVAAILSPLATVQERAGAMDRADSTYREALAIRLKLLGPEHPDYAWTMFNYADHLLLVGRNAEAAAWCRKVLALRGKTLMDSHPAPAAAMAVLGRALGRMDSLKEGERWLRESWALRKATLPPGHFLIASSESILGEHLTLAKRYPEAEAHLLAGEAALVKARGEDAPIIQDSRKRLVALYTAWEKPAEAATWRAKLRP
jgi:eukaryotic-like serine/threonine-protein kinase